MANKLDGPVTLDGHLGPSTFGPGFLEWRGVLNAQQFAVFVGSVPGPPPGPVAGQTGSHALYIDVGGAMVPAPPFFLSPMWVTANTGASWHQIVVAP